jgi:putative hydroxymethylpyrimidine transporter CytX
MRAKGAVEVGTITHGAERAREDVPPTEWGTEPVPPEHRTLSAFDLAVLWGDLGIGLLVLVTGALLVPGLGFGQAMIAIVVGSVIGVTLLALFGSVGAKHGLPTMVLLRPVLGIKGSWVPTALNVAQLVGWTAVELWAMSFVADLVSERVFGFSARGLWLGIAALVCTLLALWGPVRVVRVWMERFGMWVVGGIALIVTIVLITTDADLAISWSGTGGFPSFGAAIDLVIAMPISWLPLVCDYTRFGRSASSAFTGTLAGYLVANIWLYALGALLVLQAGATPSPEGIATGVLAIAGGSLAGILFLVGLLVGETDEAFADIYSGAVSLQNIWPKVSERVFGVGIAVIATALAWWLTMERYESFLFLIGSVFVPLFGIVITDHFVVRRGRIDLDSLYGRASRYSGVRGRVFIAWLAGFLLFHWISPSPVDWWTDLVGVLPGAPLSGSFGWLPASIPSFLLAALLTLTSGDRSLPGREREGSGA